MSNFLDFTGDPRVEGYPPREILFKEGKQKMLLTPPEVMEYYPKLWVFPLNKTAFAIDDPSLGLAPETPKLYLANRFVVLNKYYMQQANTFLAHNNSTPFALFTGKPKDINDWYNRLSQEDLDIIPCLNVTGVLGEVKIISN